MVEITRAAIGMGPTAGRSDWSAGSVMYIITTTRK